MPKKDRVLTISEAKRLASEKGLTPCKVRGKNSYEFSKTNSMKLMPLTWLELEQQIQKKNMTICESFGFMKVIKTEQKKE